MKLSNEMYEKIMDMDLKEAYQFFLMCCEQEPELEEFKDGVETLRVKAYRSNNEYEFMLWVYWDTTLTYLYPSKGYISIHSKGKYLVDLDDWTRKKYEKLASIRKLVMDYMSEDKWWQSRGDKDDN